MYTTLKWGDWLAICDRCGVKYHASQLKKTWDGLMVCEADWEPRHPQDLIRTVRDDQSVPWTRPEATDVSVGPTYIAESTGNQYRTIPSGTNNNEI